MVCLEVTLRFSMHPEAWSPCDWWGLQTSVYVPVYDCGPLCLRNRVCICTETDICQVETLLYLAGDQILQQDMPEDSQVS